MKVREIMTQLVHTIRAESTLEQASRLLRDQNIGCAPVVEETLVKKTHLKQDVLKKIGFAPVVEEDVVDVTALADLPTDAVTWVDVQGLGGEAVLRQLGETFAVHPLALEDVVNVPVRPKVEYYGDQLLVIARMIRAEADAEPGAFELEQVGLIVGTHYVLSFQERYGDVKTEYNSCEDECFHCFSFARGSGLYSLHIHHRCANVCFIIFRPVWCLSNSFIV